MRRTTPRNGSALIWSLVLVWVLVLSIWPVAAQQGTINPRIPPPPPPPEKPEPPPAPQPPGKPPGGTTPQPAANPTGEPHPNAAPGSFETTPQPTEPTAPPAWLPATVAIPAGTRIAVILETPLSTRIARQGQLVTFRTSDSLRLTDQLEIPPETAFTGSVIGVKRPGSFGKSGALRVKLERMNLTTGTTAAVLARLDSPDMNGRGRLTTDNRHSADLLSLAGYTLEGTLLGSRIKGGKGAAVGAGAGAMAALIILMSKKGSDVYLEPGMPFQVILDQGVALPGDSVWAAQQSYVRTHGPAGGNTSGPDNTPGATSADTNRSEVERNPDGSVVDPDRPRLKRRPKSHQP